MVDDPYRVLNIPRTAREDEIKKAYRTKAKEYHPDMHPDDPDAGRKMNEINEAYDMLMNPEKYEKRRAQQAQQQQASSQARQQYGSYGWDESGFGFDFEDIFGAFTGAGYGYGSMPQPQPRADDSPQAAFAVRCIRLRDFRTALNYLASVPANGRNARWYYLSAVANYGLGNRVTAWEHIQKASSMEPVNPEYVEAKRFIGREAQSYQTRGSGFNMDMRSPVTFCAGLCLTQMCCSAFCRFGFCI